MLRPLLLVLLACNGGKDRDPGTDPTSGTTSGTPTGTVQPLGCLAAASVSDQTLPLDKLVSIELEQRADAWVICTNDADPTDQLLAESPNATAHDLHVYGLAANATYTCTVGATCDGSAELSVTTDPILDHTGWTVETGPGEMSGVYTLFNDQPSCTGGLQRLFVIDPDGNTRWSYPVGAEYVLDIDAMVVDGEFVHMGGGWGTFLPNQPNRGVVRQVDWSGNVLLERDTPAFGVGFNHHSEVLPSGEILSLTTSEDTDGVTDWYGVAIEQWDPVTQSVTWSWDSQGAHDDGTLPTPTTISPYHANSVTLHTDSWGDAAYASLYYGRMIWRIDRTTGDLTHQFGLGGDFTLVDPAGNPLPDAEYAYVQHDPEYTDDGRVLLYDNGDGRPGGSYSRVSEYHLDLDTLQATLNWTWTEPNWFDPIVGDADYLDNGNVLVAHGYHWCFSFSGDTSGVIEIDPATDEVVWRMDHVGGLTSLFRAERYGGCDLFANGKYCPAVADRIAELSGG